MWEVTLGLSVGFISGICGSMFLSYLKAKKDSAFLQSVPKSMFRSASKRERLKPKLNDDAKAMAILRGELGN